MIAALSFGWAFLGAIGACVLISYLGYVLLGGRL
jgi:hypothetical protein